MPHFVLVHCTSCLFPGSPSTSASSVTQDVDSDHLEHEATVTHDNYSLPLNKLEPKAAGSEREAVSLEHPGRRRTMWSHQRTQKLWQEESLGPCLQPSYSHASFSQTHTQSDVALGSEPLTHIVFLLHFPYNLGVRRPPEDALGGESWKTRGPGEPQRSGGWISSLPYQSWSFKKGHWACTFLYPAQSFSRAAG